MAFTSESLQNILNKSIDNTKVFGTSFCTKYGGKQYCASAGDMQSDTPYFIASTTKLFTTAIVLNLSSQKRVHIDDFISKYLDSTTLKNLHYYKNVDYTSQLSVKNLLSHTSGLPDYFQQNDADGTSFEKKILTGNDMQWSFEQIIEYSKNFDPLFKPNEKNKAHYSDTNFQLLGRIIELITNKSFEENCKELIINPLQMNNTYLYTDINDIKPQTLYYKSKHLHIPKAMSSFGPDGGMVSTSEDMMVFIQAFFKGKLFPFIEIEKLKVWNKIFFPMQSGIGIHKFKLPWFFNPLGTIPELIGHSGLSGALAYYSPQKDLYITGTVNQVAYPETSFKLAIKLIHKILSNKI